MASMLSIVRGPKMAAQPTINASVAVDVAGIGVIISAMVGWIPIFAAFVSLIWFSIQIWESRTIQHWLNNRRMVQKAKKIARLKAKEKVIIAQLEALESLRQARADARDKVEQAKVEAEKVKIHEENQANL